MLSRGFDGNLVGDQGMVANLHELNEEVRLPEGLTIVRAIEQERLGHWREVFAAAYDAPLSVGQAWVDATIAAGGEAAPWKMYVGYLDGRPVATSTLFTGAGVAGVYAIGTRPENRQQGLGTAITLKPLQDARQQGYNFAVLFSSRMAYSVYKRLGFREVASKIGLLVLEKD